MALFSSHIAKRVIIAGMRRSGSTWQYNAMRIMLTNVAADKVYTPSSDVYEDYDDYEPSSWHLIKTHYFDQRWLGPNTYVFVTVRSWHDAMLSYRRFKHVMPRASIIRSWRQHAAAWQAVAVYTLAFERLARDPWDGLLDEMATVLHIRPNLERCSRELRHVKPPPMTKAARQDPVTLLFPNHRTEDTA